MTETTTTTDLAAVYVAAVRVRIAGRTLEPGAQVPDPPQWMIDQAIVVEEG